MRIVFIVLFISGLSFQLPACHTPAKISSSESKVQTPAVVDSFQNQMQRMIKKVRPASVLIVTHDHLTANGKGGMASGVCISKDGLIMTAGHMVLPGGHYEVVFPDSTRVSAKGLGRIVKLDAGFLKITQEGAYPYVTLGRSKTLKVGEPLFSISYPGSFPGRMVIKFGHVAALSRLADEHYRTTILMEPGDSGGPVFDLNGKVVGVRSFIQMPLNANFETPVYAFRKYWKPLHIPFEYEYIPGGDSSKLSAGEKPGARYNWPDIKTAIEEAGKYLQPYCIKIYSKAGGMEKQVLGTIVNIQASATGRARSGHTFVISKNSEIGDQPEIEMNGKRKAVKIVARDEDQDLILLSFKGKELKGIWVKKDTLNISSLGEILISPETGNNEESSILGTVPFDLPAYYHVGYLGIRLVHKGGKNILAAVLPGTAAGKSGLKNGDEILFIDGRAVKTPDVFINELKGKKPHDEISIVRISGGITDTLHITLQNRPFREIHVADRFTDGRSERRDDFKNVFIHDAKLKPAECGGPIFDTNGHFVGINIARYSRTSSLGMTAGEIARFLDRAIKKLK